MEFRLNLKDGEGLVKLDKEASKHCARHWDTMVFKKKRHGHHPHEAYSLSVKIDVKQIITETKISTGQVLQRRGAWC